MKVELNFVPPGGGETDYVREVEVPSPPREGDVIMLQEERGAATFIVRRVFWMFEGDEVSKCWVTAEFAIGPVDSEGHRRACETYARRGQQPQKIPADGY